MPETRAISKLLFVLHPSYAIAKLERIGVILFRATKRWTIVVPLIRKSEWSSEKINDAVNLRYLFHLIPIYL